MRRLRVALAAGLLPAGAFLAAWLAAGPAGAACVATRDASGTTRVQCDDGSAGRLRPDGLGGARGMVGDQPVRVRPVPRAPESRSVPAQGGGASGRGARQGARGGGSDPCMSGGLVRTNCR